MRMLEESADILEQYLKKHMDEERLERYLKKQKEAEHDFKVAKRLDNIAIGISVLNVLVLVIAYLDKIVSFLHYALSCLH